MAQYLIIDIFAQLLSHKIFWAGVGGWAIAQVVKTLQLAIIQKRFSLKLFISRGSMPSSHASTVSALCATLFLIEGVSALSIFSLFVAIIVIRDTLDINIGLPESKKIGLSIRTYIHTPLEAAIGVLLGLLVAFIVYII